MTVSRAPGNPENNGRIEAIWTKGTMGATLRDGSDCIVMHVQDAPAELLVSAFMAQAGVTAPTLRIDKIGLDEPEQRVAPVPSAPSFTPAQAAAPVAPVSLPADQPIRISNEGLSLIGHIERIGDAVASEGQFLGDPGSGLRLEGFQAMWPTHPKEVDLAYSVTLEGLGATETVTTGQFCGSKGESRRVTEVTFTLVGANAHKFELNGVAHFSGGFSVPITSGLPASGPSGLEHLTAIKLSVDIAQLNQQQPPNPWDQSPRTKVFKAKRNK
ncbi:hypothetical protein GJ700_06700 [Duganella sp. FT92W]|uniref:Uncharacterized protein n=1 Tax=Pseudoduganella rivuli TaxID=2666085 RepID=A0A7X2IL05_9BURK|nr:hypothetical protein [Pseudoduganella rivuli]MRV71408.1 hypothetical protein [Pseudoduganella rivuli]